MKKKILILLTISVSLLLFSCTKEKPEQTVNIFSDGKTDYTIIISENASEEEQALAKELAALSGADPEILTDASAEGNREILIGETNRAETASFKEALSENETVSAISFIVAERDGKLVILADDKIGYIYILDYIKESYITDGNFVITDGTCDTKQVAWSLYYASDLYYERLLAEADSDRYDFLNNQLNNGGNNNESSITTVSEAREAYIKLISSFDTAAFGEYSSTDFTLKNTFTIPEITPGESHPRIFFTDNKSSESGKSSLDLVRENLTAEENATQYKKYIALSNSSCDGVFPTRTDGKKSNFNWETPEKIEAKAFRYIMEKSSDDPSVAANAEIFGYEAIYAIKNAILTVDVAADQIIDGCHPHVQLMYTAACVYDWCYDLLTEEDKTQIINGCVNLLGKNLEIVRYDGNQNKVPSAQNTVYDHGAEYQLFEGYLSFAIACYDEAPEIYEYCAGRILEVSVPAQDYLAQGGGFWNGSYYAFFREGATTMANILFNRMTDGAVTPFQNAEKVITTITNYLRPDGQLLRVGDFNEYNGLLSNLQSITFSGPLMFYAANLYENSYFKSLAYKFSNGFSNFTHGNGGVSAVQFLALNDPDVDYVYEGTAPLTHTASYPNTSLFAKSANNDTNAFQVYMTMPETFVYSHAHADCGSFQIYYKGILASDSGAYTSWGDKHHTGYTMQTIASNSILVYNPSLAGTYNPQLKNMVYCGGQSIATLGTDKWPETLDEIYAFEKDNPRYFQCTSLGTANVEKNGEYLYSYMGGDMTMAYDQVTVDEVTRYMFAVATGDEKYPLVFLTFDRITSDSADYKKTALIHVQEAPTDTEDGFIIVTNTKNGNSGKMVVQNVGFDTTYTIIGGEGQEFMVNGTNIPHDKVDKGTYSEYGWGRIEISPADDVVDLTNYMLTVMYVTDASNNASPIAATEIISENLAGASIFGKSVIFSKNEKLLTKESSFTLTESGECFIAGVSAGAWEILKDGATIETFTVDEGTNLITFNATAGNYTIKPAN